MGLSKPIHCRKYAAAVAALLAMAHCSGGLIVDTQYTSVAAIKEKIERYQSANWEHRAAAVRDLGMGAGGKNDQLTEMALIIASRDSHPSVRIESLRGLEALKSKKTIERMNEMALSDESSNVRWQAMTYLAKLRDESSFAVFTKCFNSEDWLLREAAIQGILAYGNIAPPESLVYYSEKGLKDPSESVKIATLRNLQIKEEKLYPLVRELFIKNTKTSHPLLNAVLMALRGYVLDKETREDMIGLLGHKNRDIRILAYRVLKQESIIREQLENEK